MEVVSLFPVVAILWVLSLCVYSIGFYAPNKAQVAAHHAIFQLRLSVVILATTISAAIWGYCDVTLMTSILALDDILVYSSNGCPDTCLKISFFIIKT